MTKYVGHPRLFIIKTIKGKTHKSLKIIKKNCGFNRFLYQKPSMIEYKI